MNRMETPLILAGKVVAKKFRQLVKQRVKELEASSKPAPTLNVIQVGDDPASTVYVRSKLRTCEKLGIEHRRHHLTETTSEDELLDLIARLNEDASVHGILVQLPLPPQLDSSRVLFAVDPAKDVDGLHPVNVGKLWMGEPYLVPCTPQGIVELLKFYDIPLKGRRAVIIGRSQIVGKPLAALLMAENATVTVCHSRTRDLPKVASEADILVAAVGRARFVTADFVKPGAVVVDVGVNRMKDDDGEEKLVGDVDFGAVAPKVSAISPVPGGVGPMTIAMLMVNVLAAYEKQMGSSARK